MTSNVCDVLHQIMIYVVTCLVSVKRKTLKTSDLKRRFFTSYVGRKKNRAGNNPSSFESCNMFANLMCISSSS